jgi:hypothetical protein
MPQNPQEQKTASNFEPDKHVVIPVLHPSGDVHSVAVPADMSVADMHSHLVGSGYAAPDIDAPKMSNPTPYWGANVDNQGRPKAGPTKEGTVEYDPKFKDTAARVWAQANFGRDSNESGTYLDQNLDRGPIATSNTDGKMSLQVPNDAPYTIHTHPDHFKGGAAGGQPSETDIATAKKTGKYVYVVSRSGLQYVGPHGEQGVAYTSPAQFQQKN